MQGPGGGHGADGFQAPPPKWTALGKLPIDTGEHVGPSVVVFGDYDKKVLREAARNLHPTAASVVLSMHKVVIGQPRIELHCRASQVTLVESLVPLLRANSYQCAVWEAQGASKAGLAGAAGTGLGRAAGKAGLCRYFVKQAQCPHRASANGCKFVCYDGQPRQ